jgi:hypothetical protein
MEECYLEIAVYISQKNEDGNDSVAAGRMARREVMGVEACFIPLNAYLFGMSCVK